ncbi:hypothetical protein D3C75_1221830 [compost metagenome]
MADHPLDVLFALGQHGFAAQFRAGASRGRQRNQRGQPQARKVRQSRVVGDDPGPFEPLQALRMDGRQADAFGGIHRAAAAQGDQ